MSSRARGHTMGEVRLGRTVPLALVLLLLLNMAPLSHHEHLPDASVQHAIAGDPGVSDVPTWRIGDRWIYAGTFDPTVLVTDTGVDATVGEIQGDTTSEVTGITTQNERFFGRL